MARKKDITMDLEHATTSAIAPTGATSPMRGGIKERYY
jgi:hypothetical protein